MQHTIAFERVDQHEVFDVLKASGMFDDVAVTLTVAMLGEALDGANLVTVARDEEGWLVGVCRAPTDYSLHCFVATLALYPNAGGQGVGEALLQFTHAQAGDPDKIVVFLVSVPEAVGFYEAIGLKHEANCFSLNNVS